MKIDAETELVAGIIAYDDKPNEGHRNRAREAIAALDAARAARAEDVEAEVRAWAREIPIVDLGSTEAIKHLARHVAARIAAAVAVAVAAEREAWAVKYASRTTDLAGADTTIADWTAVADRLRDERDGWRGSQEATAKLLEQVTAERDALMRRLAAADALRDAAAPLAALAVQHDIPGADFQDVLVGIAEGITLKRMRALRSAYEASKEASNG